MLHECQKHKDCRIEKMPTLQNEGWVLSYASIRLISHISYCPFCGIDLDVAADTARKAYPQDSPVMVALTLSAQEAEKTKKDIELAFCFGPGGVSQANADIMDSIYRKITGRECTFYKGPNYYTGGPKIPSG